MKTLDVNVNQVDITPSEPVLLSGYANRKGFSAGVHRPLSSRCLALRTGATIVCLITNDLVDIMPDMTREMIDRIARETGIPSRGIFVHAIHTHSAPIMEYGSSEANDRYIPWAIEQIVNNAVRTVVKMESYETCTVRFGSSRCDISANRRLIDPATGIAAKVANIQGVNDEEVNILQLVNSAGRSVATLFNFACHPVVLGYESVTVSTDYPGAARETVEQALGGMAVFLNGAAGNINPRETDHTDTAVADAEGRTLGSSVVHATMETWSGELDILVRSRTVQLPYRDQQMTAERFQREVERRLGEQTEFHDWQQDLRTWAAQMIDRLQRGEVPDTCSIEITATRVGPAVFLLSQGEVFNEYQIRAKQHCSGTALFFVAYTNGARGYIPTAESFRQKGYEVDQAYLYLQEPSPLTPEADPIYMTAVNDVVSEVL